MATPQDPSAIREARRRLAARKARTTRIRRRVVAGSLAAFVISFATIAETGALGSTTVASSSTASTSGSTAAGSVDTQSDDQYSGDQYSDDSSQDTVSPVTTSQS